MDSGGPRSPSGIGNHRGPRSQISRGSWGARGLVGLGSQFSNMSFIELINWIVFVVGLTDEWRLALFPVGTIVRDPHHCESSTRSEQDLNLRRT